MCLVGFGSCITTICPVDAAIIPFISTNGPWSGYEETERYFFAIVNELSYPPYDWEWTFERVSGNVNDFTVTKTTTSTTCSFNQYFPVPCQYEVYVEVTNNHGTTVHWPSMYPCSKNNVVIYQRPPLTAHIIAPEDGYQGYVDIDISFAGSASGGFSPYQYNWNFGDGYYSTNQNPTHSYEEEGTYIVTFTVTDSKGTIDTDQITIYINGEPEYNVYIDEVYSLFDHYLPGSPIRFEITAAYDIGAGDDICESYTIEWTWVHYDPPENPTEWRSDTIYGYNLGPDTPPHVHPIWVTMPKFETGFMVLTATIYAQWDTNPLDNQGSKIIYRLFKGD